MSAWLFLGEVWDPHTLFFHLKHHFMPQFFLKTMSRPLGDVKSLKKRCLDLQATSARLLGFLEKIMIYGGGLVL